MPDSVKITVILMTGLAMISSWMLDIDPVLQKTFLSLFLAAVAWNPIGIGLRAFARALTRG